MTNKSSGSAVFAISSRSREAAVALVVELEGRADEAEAEP